MPKVFCQLNYTMNNSIVLVACTNVGRHIINLFFSNKRIKKKVYLTGIINLNLEKGANKSNYDNYYDLKMKYNLNIKYVNNINDRETVLWLKKINPSLILQSGWSQKFSKEILDIPKYGCVGQHPAPLPVGRGAACVNWAIILGYKKWGDSFFLMDEKYDNGDLIAQKFFSIDDDDTVKTIYDKVCYTSKTICEKEIVNWSRGIFVRKKQNLKKAIYFKKRSPGDGEIDVYKDDNISAYNKVRALTKPYPGAFVNFNKKKLIIWESKKKNFNKKFYFPVSVKNIFKYKNKLYLKLGEIKNSFLEIKRFQVDDSPEFSGKDVNKNIRFL